MARAIAVKDNQDWKKETNFSFSPGDEPEGFRSISAGDKVTLIITGKVQTITTTESKDEYATSSITVLRSSMKVEGGTKKTTLDEALRRTRRQA